MGRLKSSSLFALLIVATLLLNVLSVSIIIKSTEASDEWLAGWRYRRTIAIAEVQANLTDFPVLIHLSAGSGESNTDVTSVFDEVGSNYNAIAFVENGARLCFEVEEWDAVNKEAWIWTCVNLSCVSNTVLYMYCDSAQDGSIYNNANNVWQNNFTAVWHLSEPGTGTRFDSTSNNNDATPVGYSGDEKTIGEIDGADIFTGTNYLNCGTANGLNFDINDSFSISVWIKRSSLTSHDFIVSKQLSSGTLRGYTLWIEYPSQEIWWDFFHDYSASPDQEMCVTTQSTITDTNWHYVVAQYDGSIDASGMEIYIDGQKQSVNIESNNLVGTMQTNVPFCIGARYGAGWPFNGALDEVEVSNVTRSSAWINACYLTQTDQIINWGAEQQQGANSVSQGSPGDRSTQTQWTVNFNYEITYHDTPGYACLRIFNATDNSLVSSVWNNTALQNDTFVNYGSYTFSTEQDYKWDCVYYNNSGNSWTSDSNWTLTVDVPPRYQNVGENATAIPENGTIRLYGQGYDGIGLDYSWLSTNETGAWENYTVSMSRETDWDANKYALNPVLSPGISGGWTTFGSIVEENSSCWWLYYTSAPPAGSPMCICRAESTDGGYTWAEDAANNPVLTPNSSNGWENQNLLCPCVWIEGSTWQMLYTATGPYPQVGYANSTDGVHWQEYGGNPVLSPSGGWESGGNELWGVIKVNSTYYAWYSPWAGGAPPTPLRQVGLATSTNLISWNKDPNNPIFSANSPDYGSYCACPFEYENQYYMLVPYGWQNGTYKFELFRDSEPTFYSEDRTSLGYVVSQGPSGAWDSYFMDTPYVATDNITKVLNEGNMLLYYSGTGNSAMTPYSTGLIVLNAQQALTGVPGVYASPQNMNGVADNWCWSNFTWSNSSITVGTTVQWRIYYNDTYGNVAATDTHTFKVTSSTVPDIDFNLVNPNPAKPYEYGKYVEVQVYASNITSTLTGFDLTVDYNSEFLTFVKVQAWGVLGTGSTDNGTVGVVEVSLSSSSTPYVGSSGLLFTLLFRVTFDQRSTHIWATATSPNQFSATISLDTSTGSLIFTEGTIPIGQVTTPTPLTLTINLIQGDVDCNGQVNILDLATVAKLYDITSTDSQWSTVSKYDLKTDGTINLFDLVVVAANFGYYFPDSPPS